MTEAVDYKYNSRISDLSKSEFQGKFPRHHSGIQSPWKDPLAYWSHLELASIPMEKFLLPDYLVWWPEALYPSLYPHARPKCPFHDSTSCVVHDGWMRHPRHGYKEDGRVCAIIGRCYKCKIREESETQPKSFRSIDKRVIANAHDYVQTMWLDQGFDFSHRGGYQLESLQTSRSSVVQGLGFNGLRRVHIETTKRYHLRTSRKWRSYVDSLDDIRRRGGDIRLTAQLVESMRKDFCDFDSDLYHEPLPSSSYLTSMCIQMMERDTVYKRLKMQMIDGQHLSGDHSFKLCKCVVANGSKAFSAMYCIMNEFGQVVAWWLTGMYCLKNCTRNCRNV